MIGEENADGLNCCDPEIMDTTDWLLRSPANVHRLLASIAELESSSPPADR